MRLGASAEPRAGTATAATTIVIALAIAGSVAACGQAPAPTPGPIETASIVAPASGSPDASGSPSSVPGASAAVPASPVSGVLTDIDATGLASVTGFTLRLDDGRLLTFRIGTLENGAEFPPGHLAEHLATSSPVRVFFREEGDALVVYRLEDASS